MNKFRILILFFILAESSFCQNTSKLDSLLKVLPTLKEDSNKVKTLSRIGNIYISSLPKKAHQFGNSALELSKKLEWKRGLAMSFSVIGRAYNAQGEYKSSLKYMLLELDTWQELDDQSKVCAVLGNIGAMYSNLGDYVKSLEYYLESLKYAEQLNQTKLIATNLTNIGGLYDQIGNGEKAFEYLNKSLGISRKNNLDNLTAMNLGNIGALYTSLGKYDSALIVLREAFDIDEKLGNKSNTAGWLLNIASVFQKQSDSARISGDQKLQIERTKKSLEYYFEALKTTREVENSYYEAIILGNIGAIYITEKRFPEAKEMIEKSLEISKTIQTLDVTIDSYQRLYDLYKKNNEPEKALLFFQKYTGLKDSLLNIESKTKINELNIKYETEKKELQIKSLAENNKILLLSATNKKILIYGLCIGGILLCGIGFLLFRQNKLRSKQENVRLEQKLLRTQMNPHFIFNSLTSIGSYIYEHEPKVAGDYLAKFARLMRLILENSESENITLEKEIETLHYYLSLQKLRLNDNLDYSIDVDPKIEISQINIPPMLTQPFIENAIEHGFRGLKERGCITINFSLNGDMLEAKITDNGIGIVQAQQQKELYQSHKSMAIQITLERLSFLNRSKNNKMQFDIKEIDYNGKKGTEVKFAIPVYNDKA